MTHCTIQPDQVSSGYLVSGVYDLDIQNALARLRTINSVEAISIPLVFDFLCPEAEVDFSLVVGPLGQSRRLKRQLIAPSSEINSPECALTIILQDRKGDIVRVKEKARDLPPSNLWENHAFRALGRQGVHTSSTTIPTSRSPEIEPPPQITADPIKDWLKGTVDSSESLLDAFTKSGEYGEEPTPKPTTKRVRRAKGMKENEDMTEAQASNGEGVMRSASSYAVDKNANKGNSRNSIRLPNPSNQAQIGPPILAHTSSYTPISNAISWEKATISSGISCDLLGLDRIPKQHRDGTFTDHDQSPPSRRVHRTMGQRAPVGVVGRIAIHKEYQDKINDFLAKSRSRPGPLRIEMRFGQLLITANRRSSASRRMVFQEQEWREAFGLESSYGLRSTFIDRLTTSTAEAESIAAIKVRAGRSLFVSQPPQRHVTYILNCESEEKEEVTITINEDGSNLVQPKETLVGALNLHYPKRAWEARFAVIGSEMIGGDYKPAADAIARSFTVKPLAESGLDMYVESTNQKLKVESIIVKRETSHPSTVYPDLMLHLTENQRAYCGLAIGLPHSYVASIKSRKEMKAAQRLWWTASISSFTSSSTLKEQMSLRLGETASWKVEAVVRNGLISDLASLAEEVITRIDHVGFSSGLNGSQRKHTVSKTSWITAEHQSVTVW